MLQFVNQTNKDFVMRKTDDNYLCLCEKDNPSEQVLYVANIATSIYNDLDEVVLKKMDESEGEFVIPANRTSKFHVSIPDTTILYDNRSDSTIPSMIRMFAVENGLRAQEYYYPKSVIMIITDHDSNVDIEYEDPENTEIAKGDEPERVPVYKGVVDKIVSANADESITVTAIFCTVSKWNKLPDNTFIVVSKDRKLRFGTIVKNKGTDTEHTINALIRCDMNGNPVSPNTKKGPNRRNNGNQNNNSKKNNRGKKHGKRGRMSDVTSKLEPIQNA